MLVVKLWLIISLRMPQDGSTGTLARRMVPRPQQAFTVYEYKGRSVVLGSRVPRTVIMTRNALTVYAYS